MRIRNVSLIHAQRLRSKHSAGRGRVRKMLSGNSLSVARTIGQDA